jgi:hypothetical protein
MAGDPPRWTSSLHSYSCASLPWVGPVATFSPCSRCGRLYDTSLGKCPCQYVVPAIEAAIKPAPATEAAIRLLESLGYVVTPPAGEDGNCPMCG